MAYRIVDVPLDGARVCQCVIRNDDHAAGVVPGPGVGPVAAGGRPGTIGLAVAVEIEAVVELARRGFGVDQLDRDGCDFRREPHLGGRRRAGASETSARQPDGEHGQVALHVADLHEARRGRPMVSTARPSRQPGTCR